MDCLVCGNVMKRQTHIEICCRCIKSGANYIPTQEEILAGARAIKRKNLSTIKGKKTAYNNALVGAIVDKNITSIFHNGERVF